MIYEEGQKLVGVHITADQYYHKDDGITKNIEIIMVPAMHCDIPHVKVETLSGSEFIYSVHSILGVKTK